jgi:hypothetical protein
MHNFFFLVSLPDPFYNTISTSMNPNYQNILKDQILHIILFLFLVTQKGKNQYLSLNQMHFFLFPAYLRQKDGILRIQKLIINKF